MGGINGPSPLIPCLLVGLVGSVIWGPMLLNSASLVSDVQETTFSFVFLVPVMMLLLVYFVSESIIPPLLLLLVVYSVGRTLVGPLILVLLIHGLGKFFPSEEGAESRRQNQSGRSGSSEGEGWYGWGSVWLLLLFVVVNGMFSGFWLGSVVFLMWIAIFFYANGE